LNVDAILIFDAYWTAVSPPSPAAQWRATCQPIIPTAATRFVGIGCRLPVYTRCTIRNFYPGSCWYI